MNYAAAPKSALTKLYESSESRSVTEGSYIDPISLIFTVKLDIAYEKLGGPLLGIKKLIGMNSDPLYYPFCIEAVTLTTILGLVICVREVT
jgi:hypothetical protein